MYSALSNLSRRVLRGSSLALVGLGLIAACNTASSVSSVKKTAAKDDRVLVPVPVVDTRPQPVSTALYGPETL